MFLYCEQGLFATAFFIIPADHPTFHTTVTDDGQNHVPAKIQHQYGCVGCSQWYWEGRIEKVPEPLAEIFEKNMRCTPASEEALSYLTNLRVKRVWGEGLCELADGRFVATENCD